MIYDLHNDLPTASMAERKRALRDIGRSRPDMILCAVWTTECRPDENDYIRATDMDIPVPHRGAVEGLGGLRTDDIRGFLERRRPAYVSLTWNGEDRMGGGCGCERPLTNVGRLAIGWLDESGIPLDLSHLSDVATRDALDVSRGRVLITHTACRRLSAHPRNVTDDVAREVAVRGGIVGVAAVPEFLDALLGQGDNCSRAEYIDHLAYLADLIGTEHVAVGTDFCGTEHYPDGLSCYADIPALAEDMRARGFGVKDIEKILFENAERFFG